MSRSMIFHYPLPLREETSGSQVHLAQTLKAFRESGYDVALVTGYAADRNKAIVRVLREAEAGRRFDFVYAWSPTTPTLLAKRNVWHPWLDSDFFSWCKGQSIPIGLFYGDIHWRFPHYRGAAPWYRRALAIPLYRYDWNNYARLVDHLFLPSLGMAGFLPTTWPADRISALYPGCNVADRPLQAVSTGGSEGLKLFYVGGVRPPLYDLKPMIDALRGMSGVRLTLCCRAAEWAAARTYYEPVDTDVIRVVHAHGEQLASYYAETDVFGLFWQPYPYLDFAMPVKVFESLGFGVPLITTQGTEIARFVSGEDIGWAVSTTGEFRALLERLKANPQLIDEARGRVAQVRTQHTWQKRTALIARTLTRDGDSWPT
jgi:glycosyltransferase involved in cell wall biosynthesis